MGRPKKPTAEISTLEEASASMRALLLAEVELEKYRTAMDLARAAACAKYEGEIDQAITRAADLRLQLQDWYMGRVAEFEAGGRKSVQLPCGVVGRRTSPPALKPLNRTWTWGAIGKALAALHPGRFFHQQPEPRIDKDLVKAQLTAEQLRACGLKVDQDETFFAEPDRTTLEAQK